MYLSLVEYICFILLVYLRVCFYNVELIIEVYWVSVFRVNNDRCVYIYFIFNLYFFRYLGLIYVILIFFIV